MDTERDIVQEYDDRKSGKKAKKKAAKKLSSKVEDVSGPLQKGVVESGKISEGAFAAIRPDANKGNAMPAEDEEDRKMSKTFMTALTQLGPLVLGGLLEGEEGAVAAHQGAQDMLRRQQDVELKQQELQARQQAQQMTPFQAASLNLRQQQLELDKRAESRSDKGLTLNYDKFGLSKQQAGQLSDKQAETLSKLGATQAGIDRIRKLKEDVNTGPFASRGQSMQEVVGLAPEKFTELKAETENTVADYIKTISGAQASEREVERLKRVAPNINDDDKTFDVKLKAYEKIVKAMESEIGKAIASGQPLKAGTIDNAIDKHSSASLASEEETPRQRLERLRKKHGR